MSASRKNLNVGGGLNAAKMEEEERKQTVCNISQCMNFKETTVISNPEYYTWLQHLMYYYINKLQEMNDAQKLLNTESVVHQSVAQEDQTSAQTPLEDKPSNFELESDESMSSISDDHDQEPHEPEKVFIKEEYISSDDCSEDSNDAHYYPEFVRCELAPSDSEGSVLNFEETVEQNEALNLSKKSCETNNQIDNNKSNTKGKKRTTKKKSKEPKSGAILQCDICNKEFLHKHSLTTHLAAHADIRNYECPICKKKFVRKDYMIQHTKLHSIGTRNFECSICKKSYKQKKYLKEHEKLHIDSEYYKCSVCNKKFSRKDFLERHEKIHTTSEYYECAVCNIKFGRRRSKFLMHSKIHTGVKDFECTVCNKKFARKDKLRRHEKIHIRKNNLIVNEQNI